VGSDDQPGGRYRFGPFEVDLGTGELWRDGCAVSLTGKPFELLSRLLARPGQLVSRQQLRRALWHDGASLDADKSLNAAMKKLRQALDDSPEEPVYIETLRGRGYRLVAEVQAIDAEEAVVSPASQPAPWQGRRRWQPWLLSPLLIVVVVIIIVQNRSPVIADAVAKPRRLIAVIPVRAIGDDRQVRQLAEVLTEEITTSLGRLAPQHLSVVGRSSAARLEDPTVVDQLLDEVDISYLVEASLDRRSAARTVLHARLISAGDGTQVWAQRYDIDPDSPGPVCTALRTAIAAQLPIPSQVGTSLLTSGGTDNRAAYGCYLQGLTLSQSREPEAVKRSKTLFLQAAELDPAFALAHQMAARQAWRQWMTRSPQRTQLLREAEQGARQAIALAPELAEAHALLGDIRLRAYWDWQGAEQAFRRAVKSAPGDSSLRHWFAWFLLAAGQHGGAREQLETALAIDPLSADLYSDLGWFYYRAGDFDTALQHCWDALELDQELAPAGECRLRALAHLGRFEEAHSLALTSLAESDAPQSVVDAVTGLAGPAAYRAFSRWLGGQRAGRVGPYIAAFDLAAAGELEQSLESLQRAADERDPLIILIGVTPELEPLHDHPAFRQLRARIGPDSGH
jgi:DNA-binding winged helix-turn-helix (wHTH) protein/TolB-like protein